MAMVLQDEIRGRLSEVFSLKSYRIDHVVHGAIASAAVYGALMGATATQIEYAIGMFVAHYIPWRAIRAGSSLSDSKGASAAISSEVAILCMKRAMKGFIGPADIFRNPEAIFRQFEPTDMKTGDSPFDMVLTHSGDDFAVMGMHFKLGLYEHQSAGAIQGVLNLLQNNPALVTGGAEAITNINIVAYEPAFGIIGDPSKRDPKSRQSADHSMVYILSTLLNKAFSLGTELDTSSNDAIWKQLFLEPKDYSKTAIANPATHALIAKMTFTHGGEEYDSKYPDGIPTAVTITAADVKYESGQIMYPGGHARNTANDLEGILQNKFSILGKLSTNNSADLVTQLSTLSTLNVEDLQNLYGSFQIKYVDGDSQF
jgi:2-methylcitrate dehydratase